LSWFLKRLTMEIEKLLIGKGAELSALQMSIRAVIVFFLALIMLRIAGIRTFGKKSAFDNVIIIMLGAVLSRAITGSSPFLPIVCSSFILVIIHRLLAMFSYKSDFIGKLVKGEKKLLYKDKMPVHENMQSVQLSHKDVVEEIRIQLHQADLDGIKEIYIERNGEVSIIKEGKDKEYG